MPNLREAMRNRAEKELRQALLTGEALAVLHSKQNRFSTEHKKSLAIC